MHFRDSQISAIEHVADVIVGGDFPDPEQGLAVRAPLAILQGALERQKRRALHEKQVFRLTYRWSRRSGRRSCQAVCMSSMTTPHFELRRLRACGYEVAAYESAKELLEHMPSGDGPGCILLDVQIPGLSGPELQDRLAELGSTLPIIFLTGHGDIPTSVQTIKAGASDFLTKPVPKNKLLDAIEHAVARHQETQEERARLNASRALYRIAAFVLVVLSSQIIAPLGLASDYAPVATGDWGFDFTGAYFAKKPGDDFFRYANGGWYDRAVIPADHTSIGPSIVLSMTAEARTREILEQSRNGGGLSAQADASKIGAFYSAFMDEARAEALDVQPIAPHIASIRSASTRAELVDLMGASCRSFFDSIFSLEISPHGAPPGRYVVSIGQGGLGLDRDYYVAPRLAKKKGAYLTYMTQLLGMIDWQAPAETAAAILAFETAIAAVSWTDTERSDPNKTYNPMTVSVLETSAPFPWRRLLAKANLGGQKHVVVVEKTALPKIAAIYAHTPLRTLKAWQAFHLVDAAAPYLSNRFVATNFTFHGKVMAGVAEQPERWKRAVDTIEDAMGQAVGRAYVARYFSPETKAQIADLTAELRIALKARIERLHWMSQRTKRKALDKLARLNVKIGYPDKWQDYSDLEVRPDDLVGNIQATLKSEWLTDVKRLHSRVDRSEWDTTPQTVNAFYDDNRNEMILPAGMLQLPFFDPGADSAVNYGGMGALIGHEMSHGFDDEGRNYDGNGRLTTWWTRADARQFKARAAKLVRQFDGYEPLSGVHVKGNLTLDENIADLAGALVALDAYHHSLGGKPAPVIDGLTGDQRFFLSYAQSWREKSTNASIRQQIVSDPHAPVQYRVNGALRNMDAWYNAFNVKPSNKLYLSPRDRVRIW